MVLRLLDVVNLVAPVIGIVLALVCWSRSPRAAGFAVAAALVDGLAVLLGMGGDMVTWFTAKNLEDALQVMAGLNALHTVLALGAWALLLGAVFAGRARRSEVYP